MKKDVPEFLDWARGLNCGAGQVPAPADAAVLVALSGTDLDSATVLLTHRRPTLRSHGGEVSFPGGRIDPGESPQDAALREAWEEVGVRRHRVELLGQLPGHQVAKNGREVAAFIGWLSHPAEAYPASEQEVARVIHAPIRQLKDPENRFTLTLGKWQGPAFLVEDLVVWGFTAGVLNRMLNDAGWAIPWDPTRRRDYFEVMSRAANDEALFRNGTY